MIPRTVIALGLVSLLTDLSSEMIYPLLPVFLTTVLGAGAFAIGLIEAVAEMMASLLKIVSGYLADRTGRKKLIVLGGYSLSSLMRPLMGIASAWPQVFLFRFMDRVGKGLRTSPRDALIADVAVIAIRGRAFGLHRAMDHAGAVIGPLLAVLLIRGYGMDMRSVFLLSAVPGLIVILILVFFVSESKTGPAPQRQEEPLPHSTPVLGKNFVVFLVGLSVFTLGNSSDAFLLLRLQHEGVSPAETALLWSCLHLVKMFSAYTGGRLSDRIGRKVMLISGWLYYSFIYLLFAFMAGKAGVVIIFISYGIYYGLTESAERVWVSKLVKKEARGRGYGIYHGVIGIMSLPSSIVFGVLWERWGYEYAFLMGGLLALLSSVIILFVKEGSDYFEID